MKPDEVAAAADRRFPDQPVARWVALEPPDATRARLDAVLTVLARGALALPVATPVDARAVRSLVHTIAHHPPLYWRGDEALVWGVLALLATTLRDWDMVVRCTGKRALGTRVQGHRDYDGDLRGLARHLATALRSQLPAAAVAPALRSLRARYAANRVKPDGRVAIIATRLFVELAGDADVPGACRRWLAGEELELATTAAPREVAGGDPRVTIFERYAPELSNDTSLDHLVQLALEPARDEPPDAGALPDYIRASVRYAATERRAEALIPAYMARRPLPEDWRARVLAHVAYWLGGDPAPYAKPPPSVALRSRFERAVEALVLGDTAEVQRQCRVRKMRAFAAGAFFHDDADKLLAYLALAVDAGADRAAVEPAWWDFLAHRSPATARSMKSGELTWSRLLAIASVIQRLGGGDPRATGRELQRTLTGV